MSRNPLNTETHKQCPNCKEVKLRTDFYYNGSAHDKLQSRCKVCNIALATEWQKKNPERHAAYNREWDKRNPERKKETALKTRMGLDNGVYETLLKEQGGGCAICHKPERADNFRMHVDHCHGTRAIRGLLCTNCNTGLGQFKHDVNLLLAARSYIEKSLNVAPRYYATTNRK